MTKRWFGRMAAGLLCAFFVLWGSAALAAGQQEKISVVFSDSGVTLSSEVGAQVEDGVVTIRQPGTYVVTGSAGQGRIVVEEEIVDVTLIFEDLSLTSAKGAPLVVGKDARVVLQVAGSCVLADAEDPAKEKKDWFDGAAIRVRGGGKLQITGEGSLTLDGSACNNGLKGGDGSELTMAGEALQLVVRAAGHGLTVDGKIRLESGSVQISAGGDGLQADPKEKDENSAGVVELLGGRLNIEAEGDGVQAAGDLTVAGGRITICAGGGSSQSRGEGESAKGLKAEGDLLVSGGTLSLDCADDGLHAGGEVFLEGGSVTIASGEDAVHADGTLTVGRQGADEGPELVVTQSYEGLEGAVVRLYSGKGSIAAEDDGINAANRDLEEGFLFELCGGEWVVDSAGDALDSNGDVLFTGGTLLLYGSPDGKNSALDYDGACIYVGGTVLAVGFADMAQRPGTGRSVMFGERGEAERFAIEAGDAFEIRDAAGNVMYEGTGRKHANSVVLCIEDLRPGETYTLFVNGAAAAQAQAQGGEGGTFWLWAVLAVAVALVLVAAGLFAGKKRGAQR